MDGKGWKGSVACNISQNDPCDFFFCGYLKRAVFYELHQDIHDKKKRMLHDVDKTTKEQIQKMFKNNKSRLCS